ncbi:hypothetical protein BgiBS90_003352, partial [Biomphalaria glabrata]
KTFPRRTKPLWIKDEPPVIDPSQNAILDTRSGVSNDQRPYSSPSTSTMDQKEPTEK